MDPRRHPGVMGVCFLDGHSAFEESP
ncbi:H-X9-DG-CTERM domain-containing protein [Pseudomonas sp. DSV-1]